ncbi:unnamed protein product, partial [Ectocarpus sp. 12 AP-2014]
RQGTERGAGPGGSERLAEEERRRVAERERHNSYKDFQGKVEKETGKLTELHLDKSRLRESLLADGGASAGSGAAGGADSAT